MSYCDFCTCSTCTHGPSADDGMWPHAPTTDGRWICDTCYCVEPCVCPPLVAWRELIPAGWDSVKMKDADVLVDAMKKQRARQRLHNVEGCPSRPTLAGEFR